jgi:hypothetical protein
MGVIQAIYFGFDVLQPLPELGQFRRRNQDHVELDHHQAGKFQILKSKNSGQSLATGYVAESLATHIILFQYLGEIAEDPLRIQVQT